MLLRLASIAGLFVGLVGCARAGKDYVQVGNNTDAGINRGGDDDGVDADMPVDAEMHIDAPAGGGVSSTLTQTSDNNIADNNTLYCLNQAVGGTGDVSYYRVFNLADHGITTPLQVTSVTFGVWDATNATGVSVSVGTYTGTMDAGTLNVGLISNIATAGATVPTNHVGENVNTPISATIQPTQLMVVTVAAPELAPNDFVLGTTSGTQTHLGYVASNNCGLSATNTLTQGAGSLLINVTGTH